MPTVPSTYSGFLGLELTSDEWLRNHFLAKLPRRVHQISRLPIDAGERVLDVCCGPGHYAEAFAEMVGTQGAVHAVDYDPRLIDIAESRRANLITGDIIKYYCADVAQDDIPAIIKSQRYDVIVFFNCLSYFKEPVKTIRRYAKILRSGGRIILKDSDFGHILLAPFDQSLTDRVVEAAQRSRPLTFDNFLGRRLPSIARQIAGSSMQIEIWSYPMLGPMSEEEKQYVSVNLLTLLRQAQDFLNAEDIALWEQSFSREKQHALLDRVDFFFLMHEIVTVNTLA